MLYDWLTAFQNKPEKVRRTVAASLTAAAIIVVGGLWAASLPDRFSQSGAFAPLTSPGQGGSAHDLTGGADGEGLSVAGPFESLRGSFGAGLAQVREQFSALLANIEGTAVEDTGTGRTPRPLPTESQ